MPIDTVQHALHIRRKKNAVVFNNIARLWEISRHSQNEQQILAQLHPWQSATTLKFDNGLAIFLALLAVLCCIPIFFAAHAVWAQLCLAIAAVLALLSYCIYEPQKPIREVIQSLEQEMITKKYKLNYFQAPDFFKHPINQQRFITQLKQKFPVFEQGNLSNHIPFYASSIWQDSQGLQHQALIFQYHFVDEIQVRDQDGDRITVKEIHQDRWGVFIFELQDKLPTFAATTKRKKWRAPYHVPWQSSDIHLNQRLRLSGQDQFQMAKKLSPSFYLKLADFFTQREGDLLVNTTHNMLCFLGPTDLMKIQSQHAKKITDISSLRGHLRTFELPALEQLQRDLIHLLD